MSISALLAGCQHPLRIVDGADFDGTNDYMTRGADLTGNADSKKGIISFWVRLDGGDGSVTHIIAGASELFYLSRTAANLFYVRGLNAVASVILELQTNTSYTSGATIRHILASWDLATGAGHLYVNDADDLSATKTLTNDTIDYTDTNYIVGDYPAPFHKLNGCLYELYFAPGQYLDFSLEANRRKFISSSGKPVHLGATGSLPTGTAPLVYFHLDNAEAVANFATNRGTGGNFSITGTLTTASTSPSD